MFSKSTSRNPTAGKNPTGFSKGRLPQVSSGVLSLCLVSVIIEHLFMIKICHCVTLTEGQVNTINTWCTTMPEAVTMPRLMMMTSMGNKNRWTKATHNTQEKQIEETHTPRQTRQTDRPKTTSKQTDRHKSRQIWGTYNSKKEKKKKSNNFDSPTKTPTTLNYKKKCARLTVTQKAFKLQESHTQKTHLRLYSLAVCYHTHR